MVSEAGSEVSWTGNVSNSIPGSIALGRGIFLNRRSVHLLSICGGDLMGHLHNEPFIAAASTHGEHGE